jgi:hypothetical protein
MNAHNIITKFIFGKQLITTFITERLGNQGKGKDNAHIR